MLEIPENNNPNNQLASAIVGGNAIVDVTDEISCTVDLQLTDNKNAKAVTQILYGLLAMYEMQKPKNYKGEIVKESILKTLNIQQNGNNINISGGIGAQVLEQLLSKF